MSSLAKYKHKNTFLYEFLFEFICFAAFVFNKTLQKYDNINMSEDEHLLALKS
jgi:hypothetical protein